MANTTTDATTAMATTATATATTTAAPTTAAASASAASFWEDNLYYIVGGGAAALLLLSLVVCICVCRRRRRRRRPGPVRKKLRNAVHGFDAQAMAELGAAGEGGSSGGGGGKHPRGRAALLDQWAIAHVDGYQPPAADLSSLLRHLQDGDVFKRIGLSDLQVRQWRRSRQRQKGGVVVAPFPPAHSCDVHSFSSPPPPPSLCCRLCKTLARAATQKCGAACIRNLKGKTRCCRWPSKCWTRTRTLPSRASSCCKRPPL